jgi:phosphatidylserine/phosphatidylglycerophosphate/cardiolipin synthase-like enzyme
MSGDGEDSNRRALLNGTPVCEDFQIAGHLTPDQISRLRDEFASLSDTATVDRELVNVWLPDDGALTPGDTITLFVGLQKLGVATESEPGRTYAEYAFEIDGPAAAAALDQQLVASVSHESLQPKETSSSVELVGTLPEIVSELPSDVVDVLSFDLEVRDVLLEASESVRLANPYFDPGEEVIEDIASLPSRGVRTEILTRETDEPSEKLRNALNNMYQTVNPESRRNLDVRNLYARDEDRRQLYATHAKVLVVDDKLCYLGSANLTRHSLANNFELGVLLRGPTVRKVSAVFDAVFAASTRVELPL